MLYKGSHSFTCHQTRAIPAFTPQPQSINVSYQWRDGHWPGWVDLRRKIWMPCRDNTNSDGRKNLVPEKKSVADCMTRGPENWRRFSGHLMVLDSGTHVWIQEMSFVLHFGKSKPVMPLFCSVLYPPWSEGWPHHGRTFSIYLCPLSFWLTLLRGCLSMSWCCPSRPCVVFLACVHLALFLALSLSPGNFLVSSSCDHSMLVSLLWQCLTVPSLLQLCYKPTHFFSLPLMKSAESFSVLLSQRHQDSFWVYSFHSRTLLQAILALSLVVLYDGTVSLVVWLHITVSSASNSRITFVSWCFMIMYRGRSGWRGQLIRWWKDTCSNLGTSSVCAAFQQQATAALPHWQGKRSDSHCSTKRSIADIHVNTFFRLVSAGHTDSVKDNRQYNVELPCDENAMVTTMSLSRYTGVSRCPDQPSRLVVKSSIRVQVQV